MKIEDKKSSDFNLSIMTQKDALIRKKWESSDFNFNLSIMTQKDALIRKKWENRGYITPQNDRTTRTLAEFRPPNNRR